MTQHYIPATTSTGQEVMILTGWDRRIGGFFLQIELPNDPEDKYLYASHADPELIHDAGYSQEIEYFDAKLSEHGLSLPEKVIQAVQTDCELNVGNACTWYDREGNIIHQS